MKGRSNQRCLSYSDYLHGVWSLLRLHRKQTII